MTKAEIIGNNIRRMREENFWDQEELAKRLGITRKAVSAWETGRACPRMGMIEQIAEVFSCNTFDIIYEQGLKEKLNKYVNLASNSPLPIKKTENTDEQRLINIFHKLPEDKQRELLNYAIDLLTQ